MTRREAQKRKFKIMRLRGLYTAVGQLFDADARDTIRDLIEDELYAIGAFSEHERRKK